jgi:hypothetical protein
MRSAAAVASRRTELVDGRRRQQRRDAGSTLFLQWPVRVRNQGGFSESVHERAAARAH